VLYSPLAPLSHAQLRAFSAEKERQARLAEKQRAATEREAKVLEEARARHARAAEELLKKQQQSPADIPNTALKQPDDAEDYYAQSQQTPKRL